MLTCIRDKLLYLTHGHGSILKPNYSNVCHIKIKKLSPQSDLTRIECWHVRLVGVVSGDFYKKAMTAGDKQSFKTNQQQVIEVLSKNLNRLCVRVLPVIVFFCVFMSMYVPCLHFSDIMVYAECFFSNMGPFNAFVLLITLLFLVYI